MQQNTFLMDGSLDDKLTTSITDKNSQDKSKLISSPDIESLSIIDKAKMEDDRFRRLKNDNSCNVAFKSLN